MAKHTPSAATTRIGQVQEEMKTPRMRRDSSDFLHGFRRKRLKQVMLSTLKADNGSASPCVKENGNHLSKKEEKRHRQRVVGTTVNMLRPRWCWR
jgi:hypothetical protein